MSDRFVTMAELARVVQLVSLRPSSRRRRRVGDVAGEFDEWFDGGALRREPGRTVFALGDGSSVVVEDGPGLSARITFADGRVVAIRQET